MPTQKPSKSEQTRQRILAAATAEFATYGEAGSRIDSIAKTAKANKSLIYDYFGSKKQLFQAVLERHLSDVYQDVHFDPADLTGYATMLFDIAMDRPNLMRLVMWNGLEQNRAWPLDETSSFATQVTKIREAQAAGGINKEYPPDFLLTLIITLASAWTAANPLGTSIVPDVAERRLSFRAALAKAVSQLSQPEKRFP